MAIEPTLVALGAVTLSGVFSVSCNLCALENEV